MGTCPQFVQTKSDLIDVDLSNVVLKNYVLTNFALTNVVLTNFEITNVAPRKVGAKFFLLFLQKIYSLLA